MKYKDNIKIKNSVTYKFQIMIADFNNTTRIILS